jgi:hypothetical protein
VLFRAFFSCLEEKRPVPFVRVDTLASIVNLHHSGVGSLSFRYIDDVPGAQLGSFLWQEDERSSPYDEPFNDAVVFVNENCINDLSMLRIVAAKELMHVFDGPAQRTDSPEKFRRLIEDIASTPIAEDSSEQYTADKEALWKAIIALIPPWIRSPFLEDWNARRVDVAELARLWYLPTEVSNGALLRTGT